MMSNATDGHMAGVVSGTQSYAEQAAYQRIPPEVVRAMRALYLERLQAERKPKSLLSRLSPFNRVAR
jgi:hypothetical protein